MRRRGGGRAHGGHPFFLGGNRRGDSLRFVRESGIFRTVKEMVSEAMGEKARFPVSLILQLVVREVGVAGLLGLWSA